MTPPESWGPMAAQVCEQTERNYPAAYIARRAMAWADKAGAPISITRPTGDAVSVYVAIVVDTLQQGDEYRAELGGFGDWQLSGDLAVSDGEAFGGSVEIICRELPGGAQ